MSEYVDPRPLFEAHIAKPLKDLPAELDPFILEIGGVLEQQRRRHIAGVQLVAELLQNRPAELLNQLPAIESEFGKLPHDINTAVSLAARAAIDPDTAGLIASITGEAIWQSAVVQVNGYMMELGEASWWDRPGQLVGLPESCLIENRRDCLERYDFEHNPSRASERQARDVVVNRWEEISDELERLNEEIAGWVAVPDGDAHGRKLRLETLAALRTQKHDLESEWRAMHGDNAGAIDHDDAPVDQDDPNREDMDSKEENIIPFTEPRVLDDWCKVIREPD